MYIRSKGQPFKDAAFAELLEVLASLFGVLFIVYLFAWFTLQRRATESMPVVIAKLLTVMGVFLLAGFGLSRRFSVNPLGYSFAKRKGRLEKVATAVITLSLGVIAALLVELCYVKLSLAPNRNFAHLSWVTKPILGAMPLVWLAHSFGEELFFRGFALNAIEARTDFRTALLLSSALFALAHLPYSLPFFLILFLLSLLMGIVFRYFGALWSAVVFHASFNLMCQLGTVYGHWVWVNFFMIVTAAAIVMFAGLACYSASAGRTMRWKLFPA